MYSEAERIIQAEVTVHRRPRASAKGIDERYGMDSLTAFVATGRRADGELFRKIAVQFPDDLLPESVEVLNRIRERSTARRLALRDGADVPIDIFALADNTFGSCCPDEVTAKHYHADAIVHLGYACFSQSSSLPVFNDTPEWTTDLEPVREAVVAAFEASSSVVLVLHPGMADALARVVEGVAKPILGADLGAPQLAESGSFYRMEAAGKTLVVAEAKIAPPSDATRAALIGTEEPTEWCINGATFPRDPMQRFVFVGPRDAPQLHQLVMVAMHNEMGGGAAPEEAVCVVPTDADPIPDGVEGGIRESFRVVRQRIRQRMFNIEHIKAACVVGIVVASLGIQNFRETAEHVRALLIRAGKRAYIIYIGHLNQYKLANFADSVDCFCVIACPNSRIAHFTAKGDNIMKPLVSPAEVAVALGLSDFSNPAGFTTQFDRLLAVKDQERPQGDDAGTHDGTLITTRPLNVAVAGTSAVERLNERHYVGLEPKIGETAVQTSLVEGRSGIAKGYATEAPQ